MVRIFRYVQKLALAFWLGEMLFFISVFAPRVFKILPRDWAGKLQNNIFPAYFTVGVVCALLILISQMIIAGQGRRGLFWYRERRQDPNAKPYIHLATLALTAIAGGIFAYCLVNVAPRLSELQPLVLASTDAAANQEFQSLHKLSVGLNASALLMLLVLLGLL